MLPITPTTKSLGDSPSSARTACRAPLSGTTRRAGSTNPCTVLMRDGGTKLRRMWYRRVCSDTAMMWSAMRQWKCNVCACARSTAGTFARRLSHTAKLFAPDICASSTSICCSRTNCAAALRSRRGSRFIRDSSVGTPACRACCSTHAPGLPIRVMAFPRRCNSLAICSVCTVAPHAVVPDTISRMRIPLQDTHCARDGVYLILRFPQEVSSLGAGFYIC
jgi:hypothetical protein